MNRSTSLGVRLPVGIRARIHDPRVTRFEGMTRNRNGRISSIGPSTVSMHYSVGFPLLR